MKRKYRRAARATARRDNRESSKERLEQTRSPGTLVPALLVYVCVCVCVVSLTMTATYLPRVCVLTGRWMDTREKVDLSVEGDP